MSSAGNSHSVIFIGNDQTPLKTPSNGWKVSKLPTKWSLLSSIKINFMAPPSHLPHRIFVSLVPPFLGEQYRLVYVDFLGPSLALLLMASILHYGHATKLPSAASNTSPTEVLLLYAVLMPLATYALSSLSRATMSLTEMIALLGYGMFGHVFTLAVSLLFYQEESNTFFFIIKEDLSLLYSLLFGVQFFPQRHRRVIRIVNVIVFQVLFRFRHNNPGKEQHRNQVGNGHKRVQYISNIPDDFQ